MPNTRAHRSRCGSATSAVNPCISVSSPHSINQSLVTNIPSPLPAERKQSLGFDWHPECLRCEECGKRLNPGQHAEHKGVPYCHVPCYGALFGPQLFGHGSTVESHKSFGQPNKDHPNHHTPTHKSPQHGQLEQKLKAYNTYFNSKGAEIRSREVNGRLVLEGALRVYWGVQTVIHLKEDDDQRTVVTVRKRNSCRYSELLTDDSLKQPLLHGDPMTTSVVSENGFDVSQADTTCDSVTWSEDLKNGGRGGEDEDEDNGGSTSQEVSPVRNQVNSVSSSSTLPSRLDKRQQQLANGDQWDELDDLLQVERRVDENEKLYQTLPTAISKSSSMDVSSVASDSAVTTTTTTSATEQDHSLLSEEDTSATLKPEDFDDFRRRMQKEFLENANELRTSNDGTLKAGLPIDPSRINDSLKLMSKSFSGAMGGPNKSYEIGEWRSFIIISCPLLTTRSPSPSEFEDALKQYETMHNVISLENDEQIKNARRSRSRGGAIQKSESSSTCTVQSTKGGSSSSSSDTLVAGTPAGRLSKSRSGPNCFHQPRPRVIKKRPVSADEDEEEGDHDVDDEDGISTSSTSNYVTAGLDEDEATLRPQSTTIKRNANYEPKSISIKMDCYDELESSESNTMNTAQDGSSTYTSTCVGDEDGVVLRQRPPKTGSTAIKRRSGNRRSRTKLKRRCSINGHFYNRETSFFTPPWGAMMSVWVTSHVDTREVINLLLEKYKVDARAENFAVYIVRDNGEQTRVKEDDFPLVVRVLTGPHEDVAKLFLVDTTFTPEITSEVAQFINLSAPECRSILDRYEAEQQREQEKIREK